MKKFFCALFLMAFAFGFSKINKNTETNYLKNCHAQACLAVEQWELFYGDLTAEQADFIYSNTYNDCIS